METLHIVIDTLLWAYFVVTSTGFLFAYKRQKSQHKK